MTRACFSRINNQHGHSGCAGRPRVESTVECERAHTCAIWFAGVCMLCLPHPVRRHGVALSNFLDAFTMYSYARISVKNL